MKVALFLFLCVAILASANAATGEMFFITPPKDQTVREGQSVTLYCITNTPGTRHMWIKDDAIFSTNFQFTDVDHSRFSITGNTNNYNLRISNVQQRDAGSYKCVTASGSTGIISDSAQLQIQSPPQNDIPTCNSDTPLSVSIGENVHVACEVAGGVPAPRLSLYRQDQLLTENNEHGSLEHSWIVAAEDDGAIFSCQSNHILWPDTRHCHIGPFRVVDEPIGILLVPLSTEVIAGKPTAFVCRQSIPVRSSFRWTIGNLEIDAHDTRFSLDIGEDSSILHIHEVVEGLAGSVVSCVVESSSGTATRELTINLKSEYNPLTPIAPVTKPRPGYPKNDGEVEEGPVEGPFPADSFVSNPAVIVMFVVGGIVLVIAMLSVLGIIVISMRGTREEKLTQPIVSANEADFFYRSRNVPIRKTWFAPVHESTKVGISNSFPMEGRDNERFFIRSDTEGLTGCTDA